MEALKEELVTRALDFYRKDDRKPEWKEKAKKNTLLLLQIRDKLSEDSKFKEYIRVIEEKYNTFRLSIIPTSNEIKERILFYENALKTKNLPEEEAKEALQHYKVLESIVTDTAYIMPTMDSDYNLVYYIGISNRMIDEMREKYGDDKKSIVEAIASAIVHEYQHFKRGDVIPSIRKSREEEYKHLDHNDFNVLEDAEINSYLRKESRTEADKLLNHIGIISDNIGLFTHHIYVLQGIREAKSIDKNDILRSIGEVLKRNGFETDKIAEFSLHIANYFNKVEKQHGKEKLKRFFENIQEMDVKEFFKDENEKIKKTDLPIINEFEDIGKFLQEQMKKYESLKESWFYSILNFEIYDKVKSLFPPVGEGGDGGRPRKPPDDHDPVKGKIPKDWTRSKDDEEAINQWRKDRKDAEARRTDPEKSSCAASSGQNEYDLKLKFNPILAVENKLRSVIDKLVRIGKRVIIEREFDPNVINGVLYSGVKGATIPKGIEVVHEKIVQTPSVLFAVFDESGSVTSKELEVIKSSLVNVCKDKNITIISANMATIPSKAKFAVYNPNIDNKRTFLKRFVSGGTDRFHEIIYDFDELIKKKEFKENLENALRKADAQFFDGEVERPLTVNDLKGLYDEGRLVGIVFTDGELFTNDVSKKKVNKWLKYVEKQNRPAVAYVGYRGRMEKVFYAPQSVLNKLFEIVTFDIQRILQKNKV